MIDVDSTEIPEPVCGRRSTRLFNMLDWCTDLRGIAIGLGAMVQVASSFDLTLLHGRWNLSHTIEI